MRITGKATLALLSTVALAGTAVAAVAAERVHYLLVALPDGSVQHIRLHHGDVAPNDRVPAGERRPARRSACSTISTRHFAQLDLHGRRDLDRQGDAMLRQAAMLSAEAAEGNGQLNPAVTANMPAGSFSYSFVLDQQRQQQRLQPERADDLLWRRPEAEGGVAELGRLFQGDAEGRSDQPGAAMASLRCLASFRRRSRKRPFQPNRPTGPDDRRPSRPRGA